MFYKNILYVAPIFYLGPMSNFSGPNFYDSSMYQVYNLLFTGLPICWFCTFDWEYDKKVFLSDPKLY
jgi:hypothetical protein